jgi:1-pyrroline-4-hydroxy-2-carboxylate deaminase
MPKPSWTGVYPAVTTKFFENQKLDLELFKFNIQKQIEAGVHGIIVCGSLGENSSLLFHEKLALLSAAKEITKEEYPLIMTVAESNTSVALDLVKESRDLGADGFMVLPPMRYPADDREVVHYLLKVINHGQLPGMIYNNPLAYKTFVSIPMFKELLENPLVESTKESTGDIRYMTDLINAFGDRLKIMSGVDDLALESLHMGAHGWIAGLVDAFPEETVAIYELQRQGRHAEALAIYRWFFPLLHLDVNSKFIQNIKLAELATGLGSEWVREPRLPLIGEERAHVLSVINDALKTRSPLPRFK